MTTKLEGFFELPFENGKPITDKQLKDAYDKGHYNIHIDLTDELFSPEITLFDSNELGTLQGGVIHIDNKSSKSTQIASAPGKKPEQLRGGYFYSASGNKNTGWNITVKSII
nr:hypothetical protein [uncultured Moellerella sp.]